MSQLLDIVAIVIVLCCALYALHALLPASVLARLTGNAVRKRSGGCGGCSGSCGSSGQNEDKCHQG
jgi:hypothetical protein